MTVEMPPHRFALRPHARTDALSLRSVFSFLPSGAILALGTNALFNTCAPSTVAESAASAPPPTEVAATASDVCTSYVQQGSAHPRLLRTSSSKTSRFVVQAVERQRAPRPQTQPSIRGRGRGKGRG